MPVFNVEPYVETCLCSLLNQTYENIEIICIVSESSDESICVCRRLANESSKIRIIEQPANGVSFARNTGLDEAKGEYISFVDPDDYVQPNFIERLHQMCVVNQGISMCNYDTIRSDVESYQQKQHPNSQKTCIVRKHGFEVCRDFFVRKHAIRTVVVWNKLYHRSIFDGVRFPVGCIHEDDAVMFKILYECRDVALTTERLYTYRVRRKLGITGSEFSKRNLVRLRFHETRRVYFNDHGEFRLGARANVLLGEDIGYFMVCVAKHVPDSLPLQNALRDWMYTCLYRARRDIDVHLLEHLFLEVSVVEFELWLRCIRLKQHIQTLYSGYEHL